MTQSEAVTRPAGEPAPRPGLRVFTFIRGLNLTGPAIVFAACLVMALLAVVTRPHPQSLFCYSRAPTFQNCDLPLWADLAQHPLAELSHSVLANRPLFAWMGWLFTQPLRLFIPDSLVAQVFNRGAPFSTLAGLQLANIACYVLSALFLYGFAHDLTGQRRIGLLAALLWATSPFAYFWSYHPTNQMAGLAVVGGFSYFLLKLNRRSGYWPHILFGLIFGVLLLVKAYLVLPLIYLAWGAYRRFRPGPLFVGVVGCLLPYLLWPRMFAALTGGHMVDFHFGEGGALAFLLAELANPRQLARQLVSDFLTTPAVLSNPLGIPIVVAAVGFYLQKSTWRAYPRLVVYAGLHFVFFFLALSASGWYILRHGSDLFLPCYVAAGLWIAHATVNVRPRWLIAVGVPAYLLYFLILTRPAAFGFLGFT